MAPSAHDIVWAGTGEPWIIRPYYTLGDGVYKSTDAGRTWRHMGLDETGHIPRIVVDPHDANVVYVCAHRPGVPPAARARRLPDAPTAARRWQQVLFVNESTGCSDLAMDPRDSEHARTPACGSSTSSAGT